MRHAVMFAFLAVLILPPAAARADAIDGTWCFNDGRNLTIRGPDMTTPGGRRIKGDYGRHDFSYVVPAGEAGAGKAVDMRLIDDDNATYHRAEGPAQHIKRCSLHTS